MIFKKNMEKFQKKYWLDRKIENHQKLQNCPSLVSVYIIDLENLGERTISIDCDVIQADGGTRTASITGAYVALVEAVNKLAAEGVLDQNPLIDAAAAVSVGVVGDRVLLDLCYEEDVQAQTDMNLVMTGSGGIVEVQGTAEGRPFTRAEAEQMLDMGSRGIQELLALQKAVLNA